jgi:hypothetical protein
MEEDRVELALEERDEGQFVLSKTDHLGTIQELILSEMEVMHLGRLAPSFARQLSASKSPDDPGISALVAVPVNNYSTGSDLHQEVVILRLLDDSQALFDFSMGPTMADNMGRSLID